MATFFDLNPDRPGVIDVSGDSKWYHSVNPTNVPSELHYFNFYTDIQINAHANLLFYKLPSVRVLEPGDLVMLKGTSNPTDVRRFGGARFLPGGTPTTDRYEFSLVRSYDFAVRDLRKKGGAVKAVQTVFADNANHLNFGQNIGNGSITIASCKTGTAVKPLDQIIEILHDPAHVC